MAARVKPEGAKSFRLQEPETAKILAKNGHPNKATFLVAVWLIAPVIPACCMLVLWWR